MKKITLWKQLSHVGYISRYRPNWYLICGARWLYVLHDGGFSFGDSHTSSKDEKSVMLPSGCILSNIFRKDIKSKFSFVLVFCLITSAIKKENDNKNKTACRVGYSFPTSYRLIAFQLFCSWSMMVVVNKGRDKLCFLYISVIKRSERDVEATQWYEAGEENTSRPSCLREKNRLFLRQQIKCKFNTIRERITKLSTLVFRKT